jgi:hypothetical protein
LQRFPGVTECVALGAAKREFSTVASLMSLPHLLRAESIPAPYDPTGQVTAEAHPRQSGRLKVGLAWAGNQKHQQDRLRSIPLSQWESLAQTEGVEFTSLQMGPDSLGVINPENRFNFAENCADLQDFAELAAVVAKQDLVIAVDTAVAHLAGTMGKPVWILLSNASDWRWGLHGSSTDWYPSAKLFRQTTPGDWSEVMASVMQELQRQISDRARQ